MVVGRLVGPMVAIVTYLGLGFRILLLRRVTICREGGGASIGGTEIVGSVEEKEERRRK